MPLLSPSVAMRPIRTCAVVLNYRGAELTLRCLDALVGQMDPAHDRVVVVDNQSADGSAEKIRAAIDAAGWPHVDLVEAPENRGFASGNNLGISSVDASAYLLLNNDALVRPGAVETLRNALDAEPRVGIVSPRLEWEDGTQQISCFRTLTPWSEFISAARTGVLTSLLGRWNPPIPIRERQIVPGWTSFAAVLIRSDALREAGLLDESFFMYYEDVACCARIRRNGWDILHEPRARVVHLRGGTSPVKSLTDAGKRRPAYYYASRRRYFEQAYGKAGFLAANVLWTLGRCIGWLRDVAGGRDYNPVDGEFSDNWRG